MTKLTDALRKTFAWMAAHFDVALLLAAAVEIPRWTVTFLAIHEPLWVGIPLGALLAYATSEGWKAYFADKRRWMLLTFNIASLAAATFVITPVLFSMASAPIDEIDLAALLPPLWLLAWSGVLAVTTFAPLIQLAAVKSAPIKTPTETPATSTTTKTPLQTPVALPEVTLAPSGDTPVAEQTGETNVLPQPDPRTRALQLRDEGYTAAEAARMTGAKYSTVQSWYRRATVQTNGVQQ